MLRYILPAFLRGSLNMLWVIFGTFLMAILIFSLSLIKYLFPIKPWLRFMSRVLNFVPTLWGDIMTLGSILLTKIDIETHGFEKLSRKKSYFMMANHQSWADVLLLYRVFNHKVPVLKFFIKSQFIRMPFVGWGCWLMDFPFLKRYTKEQIAKNPKLKGKDIETTKKMCARAMQSAMTVVSFTEGTRYRPHKAKRQKSPYQYLLRPKAGGIAYTLMVMGDKLDNLLNVTIIYPEGKSGFWHYLNGTLPKVIIKVEEKTITKQIIGDYSEDREFRVKFQQWLNNLWLEKDKDIAKAIKENSGKKHEK
jgi:1-acyl-sn-glycerol-3-phosphate acyltransferase